MSLGIEGKDVTIEQTGDKKFRVAIPRFIFLGHYDPEFELVSENNGVLRWVTPEVNSVQMINKIMNSDEQQKYIDSNSTILRDHGKNFYTGIIHSIDPEGVVNFDFK